jgi:hypothetical protein
MEGRNTEHRHVDSQRSQTWTLRRAPLVWQLNNVTCKTMAVSKGDETPSPTQVLFVKKEGRVTTTRGPGKGLLLAGAVQSLSVR